MSHTATNTTKKVYWNWGRALILVFILGASGIIFLVYKSLQMSAEMVTENYYAEELKFQDVINARTNANHLSAPVQLSKDANGIIVIAFPKECINQKPKGEVYFYNPSAEKKDYKTAINIDENGLQVINSKNLQPGTYNVIVNWEMNGKSYSKELPFSI